MPAMTMRFDIRGRHANAQSGDRVAGTLVMSGTTEWIENLAVTGRDSHPVSLQSDPTGVPSPGDEVPDFALLNQDDRAIHVREFRGRILLVTFLYTRCPFPDYCPLMMKNFNAVRRTLAAKPDLQSAVQLMSVSIDPENDTPTVLRKYGEAMIAGPRPFENWDLVTGTPGEIRRMATWFGLEYGKENGQIVHSLATAIIGSDGRLVRLMSGNDWRPEEAVGVMDDYARRTFQKIR